ncbi:glycosyltransferase [Gluconacetobacter sp. SXCC-1]|nr:glycosyltransferase [Gluconacetobacter sp. SXCC-1]
MLPPVSPVGDYPHYFWVLQKWLHAFRSQKSTIVIPTCYISAFKDKTRWEYGPWSAKFHGYKPTMKLDEQLINVQFYPSLPEDDALRSNVPPVAPAVKFYESVYHEDDALISFYKDVFESAKDEGQPLAIAWVNNTSLRHAAFQAGVKLVFNEIGPLRQPFYRQTAYWDCHGVNGDTSVVSRWNKERPAFEAWLSARQDLISTDDLRHVFTDWNPPPDVKEKVKVGLALQIESDSNALLFSRGWTNLSLSEHLRANYSADDYRIRYHPNGKALYEGMTDRTESPLEFLFRVGEIWTINSSLGMEAFFWERPVRFFGKNPVASITTMTEEERKSFRSWFFLCYLIPWQCVFSIDYYIWRLEEPSCAKIAERHLLLYAQEVQTTQSSKTGISSDMKDFAIAKPWEIMEMLATNGGMLSIIEKQRKQIQDRDAWISERDEAIALMRSQIQDRDAWISERDEAIALMRSQIQDRDIWIKDRDGWISERDTWIIERDEIIALLQKKNKEGS